jgi:restriction system protein
VVLAVALAAYLTFAVWRDQRTATEMGASDGMQNMRWQQVVSVIRELFGRRGYEVRSGDEEGVDLVLESDRERVLVMCDQWKVWTVGTSPLFRFYKQVRHNGATRGIVLTTGDFTPEARDFASATGLELVDGRALENLVLEARIAA